MNEKTKQAVSESRALQLAWAVGFLSCLSLALGCWVYSLREYNSSLQQADQLRRTTRIEARKLNEKLSKAITKLKKDSDLYAESFSDQLKNLRQQQLKNGKEIKNLQGTLKLVEDFAERKALQREISSKRAHASTLGQRERLLSSIQRFLEFLEKKLKELETTSSRVEFELKY